MDLNLKGRVAVITGGAAGIGEAIARALAAEGCKICIVDRNAETRPPSGLDNRNKRQPGSIRCRRCR